VSKKYNSIICLVESCTYNDGNGGCVSDFGHIIISLKNDEAVCNCYEISEETPLRLVVNNKKPT